MSHNLVQKRGRYPKTKQENNLAQGGWQAQTLSVPSQSQGFSEVDPNYQNQIVDTQQTRLYNSQWTEHQNVMSEEPQHKLDPNGHSMQQDVWNDWGDQGWENWDNNNSQQSQPIQSYHAQQQYQPAQSQQPVQYAVYDQGYHNQQDVQELPVANKQAYEHYPQQVDQNNLSYPASCSTPHYQYNEENSVPPFSPDAHLEGQAAGTRTEVQQTYPSQTTSPASVVAEQIDNQDHLHLQNQQQVFNHASFQQQQQHTFNPQHQQSQGLPQHYNSMNYAQESQNHQHANAQQLTDYSQGYPYAEPDCGTQEENLLNCVEKSSFAVDSGEQLSSHATYDSKPMSTSANPGAGGDEIMREKNDGDLKCGNEFAHNDEDVRSSPQNSHEHRDEPISDSWDTLEDNLEGLSIQDQSEEADAIGQGVTNAEVDPQQFQQPQHYQRGDAHFGGEVSQQCVQQEEQQAMNAHFQRNQLEHQQQQEQHRQQQQLEHQQQQEQHQQLEHQQQQQQQQEQQRKLQQQQQQLSSQQQFPPQESRGYHVDQGQQVDCAEERQQLGQQIPHEQQSQQYHQSEEPSQTVGVLPSLSEVLQAKSLKSESIAVENFRAPNLMDASDPEESTALAPPLNEPVSENRASRSSSSSSVGRRDSFVNAFDNSAQERITYMADMVRPASEGAAATDESAAPVSFPLPSNAASKPAPNIDGEDSQSEIPYEPIAAREVIGQRATSERSAPAGLDPKASLVRQSPLGGEGGSLAPPPTLSKAPSESPKHGVNGESYRCGSQDENPRSRRSRRSSSSEDSAAEHDREIMHQKMREREHELPAVSKRDQKWKSSRERLREHDYHSDESEVRKQRRRSNRDSDGERARRKYASDRDYEADEYYDNRRYRRRKDHRRDSDETEYSEYASDRRHRYRSEDDTDALSRSKGRSDENRRQRSKKYLDDSDFDSRRAGRRGNDRKQRDKRHDFYYNRPPSRDSSLNDSIATSQISDSEVSMYGNRRTRHPTFDRHPAMGVHSVYDSRNFQSPAHGFPTMSSSLHPRQPQIIRSQPQREHISDGMIPPELGGHDTLQALRSAYLTDPDYRDIVDEYFASCVADGYDVSQMRSYICGGANLTPSVLAGPTDLNGSLMSPIPFESSIHVEEPGLPEELRKYTRPHAFACFTSLSSLVKLHPSQRNLDGKPPVVEIHDLKLLLEDDPESKALAKFPGPLVRAETHKNQVIHFCNQRVTAIRKNKPYVDHVVDRESYVLLWELLILLLRQNGHVTGTDIAELLLKDAPYVDPASVQKLAEQDMSQVEESDKASSDDSETTVDGTRLNRRALENRRRGLSHDQALSKFRELLLFGHRKEAIEHAIRYELWGHAFCLSSKMDIKFHTYVHSKFYQSFAGNDPLQTVYQLYSGRQPTSVTCVGDVTWGDWRPHLAMILANPSARPEIDARSIITMGDILLSKGCLCAAHFCYLMAQVDFGEFQDKRCKLVLLGSNHLHNFTEFATNEAIVCTEIYEYAQSLSNPGYTLPTLGLYKYLHAKRLVDQGFVQEGLHYCERLAIEIVRNVDAYKPELVHEVYCLASRLRYNDAHYSNVAGNYDDLGHPQWLVNLEQVNDALQRGLPTDRILESRRSSDFENSNIKLEASSYAEPSFLLQNQQQQEQQGHLAMGEQYQQQIPQPTPTQQQYAPRQQEVYDYYSQQVQEQPQRQQPHQPSYYTHPNELATHEELKEEDVSQATVTPDYSNEPYSRSSSNDEIHQNQAAYPTIPEHQNPYAAPSQLAQRQSVTSISSSITSASTNDSVLRPALAQREVPSFQPKATSQAPPKAEAPSPQTSTSAGKKTAPTSRAGQSWLNGIFKSFLPKGPNQMILPDDKDQSIVWDNEKKTWVDKNADPASQESSLVPPPSDHSLGAAPAPPIPFMSPQQPSLQDAQPAVAAPSDSGDRLKTTATPPSGTNRFQRITNKPRYVDVFKQNNQTAPAAQQMAPILPEGNVSQFMMPSAQPQFFVPTPPTGAQDEPFDLMSNRVDYDDQQLSQETEKQSGK